MYPAIFLELDFQVIYAFCKFINILVKLKKRRKNKKERKKRELKDDVQVYTKLAFYSPNKARD